MKFISDLIALVVIVCIWLLVFADMAPAKDKSCELEGGTPVSCEIYEKLKDMERD